MCIAIVRTPSASITKKTLKTCDLHNPDGCGFSYVNEEGKLVVFKSMYFKPFYKALRQAERSSPESHFLIHFRIKTHGQLNEDNCHPFFISEEATFIHNGIISNVPYHKDKSDTRMFNELILRKLPTEALTSEGFKELAHKYIGGSKLCILRVDNTISIVNEKAGEWVDGVWFSNSSYKPRQVYQATTYSRHTPDPITNVCGKCKKSLIGLAVHINTTTADGTQYPRLCTSCFKVLEDYVNPLLGSCSPVGTDDFMFDSCDVCDTVEKPVNLTRKCMDGIEYYVCKKCAVNVDYVSHMHHSNSLLN